MLVKLNEDELAILQRVISVPLYAFGLEELLQKTQIGKEIILNLVNKLDIIHQSASLEIILDSTELSHLIQIFDVSCEIVDPTEMHTLTGYEWSDAQNLLQKLKSQ